MVVRCSLCVFFFFKQKTAYELRISDWSSDVCSSDLQRVRTEIGLPLPDADNQWRSQPRADQQIRLAAAQDSERERPAQLRQHVANRVNWIGAGLHLFTDQMGDDLGVGLAGEDAAARDQRVAKGFEIFVDAIVEERQSVV